MFIKQHQLKTDVYHFLGAFVVLLVVGFLFIYSSSSIYALKQFNSASFYVQKQFLGLSLALCVLLLLRFISLEFIAALTPTFFWSSLALTAATLLPKIGVTLNGSSRWLHCGITIVQPSELLKVTFILYIAQFLAKKKHKNFTFLNSYLPFLIIIGLVSCILLKQPDFGLSVTLLTTAFIMFFLAGFPLKHLIITGFSILPIVILLITNYAYRLQRILIFLDPWKDPQGKGFQIIQSLIAIGSGHWLGSGIAQSKQKFFYLPMQHTDFIFAIIAEETGFIGAAFIIILYLFFLYCGCKIAMQLKEKFHIFAVLGFTLLLCLQALINILVVIGLLPTKGIGLPFISYGNSSLISSCAMIGLIVNMATREYKR